MLVKTLGPDDQEAAVALWRRVGLTRPWNHPGEDFERAVMGASSAVLGAVESYRVLGTAMVGHDGHRGWVYYVAVDPAVQRQGLGRLLMGSAERWVLNAGVHKLQLMVRNSNSSVIEFYESLQYSHEDVVVMARWLDGPAASPAPSIA